MDEKTVCQKYEETAKAFEHLLRNFYDEEPPLLLLYYGECISQIEELLSLERDPTLLEGLENVSSQIKWQQGRIRDAYSSDVNPENPQRIQAITNASQEEKKPLEKKDPRDRLETIRSAVRQVSGSGLKDLAGLQQVKALLRRSVLMPFVYPKLFTDGRQPWREILLYGPPGTGKSRLAAALAVEASATFYSVSSADLLSSWLGESEKMIKDLFEFTRTNKDRTILFIDEVDSLCRRRNSQEGEHSRRIKNQLLVELDQCGGSQCVVLCATNCPWDLDVAFMRRFHCRIFVPLPDSPTRIEIIRKTCGSVNLDMKEEDWEVIAGRTEGYSGADLLHLTNFALHEPLGELENNQTWILIKDKWIPCASNTPQCVKIPIPLIPSEKVGVRDVMVKDFLKAIEALPKTLDPRDLERYKQYSTTN